MKLLFYLYIWLSIVSNSLLHRPKALRSHGMVLSALKFNGPGETEAKPNSMATNSRNELAKVIVASAIFYMTVQINIEKALSKWLPQSNDMRNTGVQEFPNGIKYQDITIGNGPELQMGDIFEAKCKLFYNGLEIENNMLTEGASLNSLVTTFQKNDTYPMAGVIDGLNGLRVGGRRKIVLPSNLAFGDIGLPPYIPPNASVLYDINLVQIM